MFEGYALPHAIHATNVAGQDVTMKLMNELQSEDVSPDHFALIREMKEQMCHVPQNYRIEMKSRDDPLN